MRHVQQTPRRSGSLGSTPFCEPWTHSTVTAPEMTGAHVVMMALFTKAWNSLYCAHDLASRGYYGQSLNLVRQPVEDWASYWYLRVFPDRWEEFTETSKRTPRFEEMLETIEAANDKPKDVVVRGWMKRLHKFSHVDSFSVRVAVQVGDEGSVHYRLGPEPQEWPFRYCTSESIAIIGVILEAIDNFLRLIGRPTDVGPQGYLGRVIAWQKEQARDNPQHEDELAEALAQDD